MNNGSLIFPVVPHQDGMLAHHLEVGSLPDEFLLSSVVVTILGDYEELG